MNTSHGYHEIWCKDITMVEVGKVKLFGLKHKIDYESKIKAVFKYNFLKF